ncbi:hypothetical protein LJR084_008151 [Variovorax sp. LjRoot84]|uniref:hypothetical protein n=1 Tax=Variovorax sp. LjRoot84 TaxID=3342340 RepID=UPI003ECC8E55
MDKLLAAVLDAHGGLQELAKAAQLTAQMSLGGPFWAARGWPGVYGRRLGFILTSEALNGASVGTSLTLLVYNTATTQYACS